MSKVKTIYVLLILCTEFLKQGEIFKEMYLVRGIKLNNQFFSRIFLSVTS